MWNEYCKTSDYQIQRMNWCSALHSFGWWRIAKLEASWEPQEMNLSFPPGRPSYLQNLQQSCPEWIGRMAMVTTTPTGNQKKWDEHLPSPRTEFSKKNYLQMMSSFFVGLQMKWNCHQKDSAAAVTATCTPFVLYRLLILTYTSLKKAGDTTQLSKV